MSINIIKVYQNLVLKEFPIAKHLGVNIHNIEENSVYVKALLKNNINIHVQPNCIHNWKNTTHNVRFAVNFPAVFRSFGTELSDATEEQQWRKFVQRAINVRNRHPELDDQTCRLCHAEEESMLHLIQCQQTHVRFGILIGRILKNFRTNRIIQLISSFISIY